MTEVGGGIPEREGPFNPHHREGGDGLGPCHDTAGVSFNPHHREGGDGLIKYTAINNPVLSIHTTAKVVTLYLLSRYRYRLSFNPHHREGGDSLEIHLLRLLCPFNPHHREGGDQINRFKEAIEEVFQSTPPRRW